MNRTDILSGSPQETFEFGEQIGRNIQTGDVVLLYGGLGAGKTLLTKGIMNALAFDVDEVTSPSFALVNLYKTENFDVYHIDPWRLDKVVDVAAAVGLNEILESDRAVAIIEWADKLGDFALPNRTISVFVEGDGDEPRKISLRTTLREKI